MESPTKTIRPPLELHSPSNSNIDDNTPSPNDGKGSAMKGTTPSSSSVVAPLPPRLPDDDNNENENRHTSTTNNDDEDGRYEHPFYLSPIGRMDLGTPATTSGTNNDMTLETPNNNNTETLNNNNSTEREVDESFPDNRDEIIEIQSSTNYDNDESNETDSLIGDLDDVLNEMNGTAAEENQDDAEDVYDDEEEEEDDNYNEEEEEETEEERMQREIEESEALARQLMGKKVEIVCCDLTELLFRARN